MLEIEQLAKPKKPKHPYVKHTPQSVETVMASYVNVKDISKPRKALSCGRRTKMGIQQFMATVFEMNELNPSSKKLTNSAIERLVMDEFPNRPSLIKGMRKGGKWTVNTFRADYNNGKLTQGMQPAKISFRYNELGQAVEPRNGRRVLTVAEKQETIQKFRNKYKRKFGLSSGDKSHAQPTPIPNPDD
jgi:hypothetical protein